MSRVTVYYMLSAPGDFLYWCCSKKCTIVHSPAQACTVEFTAKPVWIFTVRPSAAAAAQPVSQQRRQTQDRSDEVVKRISWKYWHSINLVEFESNSLSLNLKSFGWWMFLFKSRILWIINPWSDHVRSLWWWYWNMQKLPCFRDQQQTIHLNVFYCWTFT